jgi:Protein of unknown function (DUF1217)
VLTTAATYRSIAGDLTKALARTAADPVVARETQYYLGHIGEVKSIDDFLGNRRLFAYAMKAFGLGDMTNAKGLIRKILEGGVEDRASLANKFADSRYREFAAAFDFAKYGQFATTFKAATTGTSDAYVRQSLELKAGDQNDGVRLALYFQRKAPAIKSAYGILADKALVEVVRTALALPTPGAAADIDSQAAAITRRLDLKDLQDPDKLQRFLQRFAAQWDATHAPKAPTVAAIGIGNAQAVFGNDLLLALQGLKLGGV